MKYDIVEEPRGGEYSIHRHGCSAIKKNVRQRDTLEADSVQAALESYFADIPAWIPETKVHNCTKTMQPEASTPQWAVKLGAEAVDHDGTPIQVGDPIKVLNYRGGGGITTTGFAIYTVDSIEGDEVVAHVERPKKSQKVTDEKTYEPQRFKASNVVVWR